ncbi:MAG: CHAT domain-containing protein [Pseudomonadota bacterium]
MGQIPPFDIALANQLYDALLKPVEPGWKSASSLIVVTDGALGQLPLGVLVTSATAQPTEPKDTLLFVGYKTVPFLARQVAITQLPSVATLPTLRALPAASASRKPFVGFGDPLFNPQQPSQPQLGEAGALTTRGIKLKLRSVPKTEQSNSADLAMLPRLPDTADEMRSIARALNADPDKDVFLGAAANEHTVETMDLGDRRVIAFATHGLVPGDLDGLSQPALALSAPAVGAGGDGLLTMDEVLALKLNADWSCCRRATRRPATAPAPRRYPAWAEPFSMPAPARCWSRTGRSRRSRPGCSRPDLFRRQADNPQLTRTDALQPGRAGVDRWRWRGRSGDQESRVQLRSPDFLGAVLAGRRRRRRAAVTALDGPRDGTSSIILAPAPD